MTSLLAQLRDATVTIGGDDYALDDYPTRYIDYLRNLTDDDLVYIRANVEQDGYTPDTAPSDVFEISDVNRTLLSGKRSYVVSMGSVEQQYVESFDGALLFDGDLNHPAGIAAAWCRANLADSAWAIDIDGFEEGDERAVVWFVFSSPDELADCQAAMGAGA